MAGVCVCVSVCLCVCVRAHDGIVINMNITEVMR